jgi:hypothetical protein
LELGIGLLLGRWGKGVVDCYVEVWGIYEGGRERDSDGLLRWDWTRDWILSTEFGT